MANYDNARYSYNDVLNGVKDAYFMRDDSLRFSAGVKTMQQKFNYAGYNCGTPDGKFGAGTEKIVREFQADEFIGVDGKAGKGTISRLEYGYDNSRYSYNEVLNSNSAYYARDTKLRRSTGVQTMQEKLRAAGYSCSVDGQFGAGTASAVKKFQAAHGLSADGRAGRNTLRALGSGESGGGSDVHGDYITAGSGGWLKLYKKPTCSKPGRAISIPSVASFRGSDGFTYAFTNRNYWYAYENPYGGNKLNPAAISRIRAVTGSNPVVKVGANGEYTDEHGNYWMAVGPKVPYPAQASGTQISPNNMYATGKLDVVVKDSSGTRYYIPGVIGDTKAHTWSNGVIQTFKAYPNGAFESARGNFNGTVCAEFIGALNGKLAGLGKYSVEKIIFYAN